MYKSRGKVKSKSKSKSSASGAKAQKQQQKSVARGREIFVDEAGEISQFRIGKCKWKKYPKGEEGKEAAEQLSRVAQKYRAAAWDICFAV